MKAIRVAFFDSKPYEAEFFDEAFAQQHIDAKHFPSRLTIDSAALAHGFQAACVFINDDICAPVVDALADQKIKLLALRCAGYNNVDLKACQGRLRVARVPAYSPHAIAEHALALIMTLNRKTHKAYFRTRDNNFSINGLLGFDMKDKTAGIVGTGKIGKVLIKALRGLDMNVIACDLRPDEHAAAQLGYHYVDLDTLLRQSDIISLHCPLTRENVHMINPATIAHMKPGVMIINTGRGKLIDSLALLQGLKTGKIGAAGLDVYEEEEEYFFEDLSSSFINDDVLARLLTFPNVLVTSHQAFFTREALQNIAQTTAQNIADFFNHSQLPNEICYRCPEVAHQK